MLGSILLIIEMISFIQFLLHNNDFNIIINYLYTWLDVTGIQFSLILAVQNAILFINSAISFIQHEVFKADSAAWK